MEAMTSEREAFEAAVRQWPNYSERTLARDGHYPEYYGSPVVQGAWEGWKARAHLAQPAQAVDVDYVPGELDRTAPERVWLQIDTSASNDVRNEVWPGADGVTWQDESIGGLEIQYVRADLVPRALSGEKAGPVGDGFDGERYTDMVDAYDEALAQGWNREQAMGCAIRAYYASPTPDKEGA